MTLMTEEDILIWRRRLCIALYGGIVLEEALDLSSDRVLNEWMNIIADFQLKLRYESWDSFLKEIMAI